MELLDELAGWREHIMLTPKYHRPSALLALCWSMLIAGCAYVGAASPSVARSPAAAASAVAAASTSPAQTPELNAATTCETTIKQVQNMVIVNSGQITVSGAFLTTGKAVAAWQEQQAAKAGFGIQSPWRDKPDATVVLCFYDGDFTTTTPGPPGHDNSASRVVVTVSGGFAELLSLGKAEKIPVVDPNTMV